ncbi:ribonuclease P protein component [bacterium]|nr:ribonuclease P protein component [bacterium]
MTTLPTGVAGSRRIKAEALRRRSDFDRIYRQGRRFRGKFVTAIVLSGPIEPGLRVAYVVSRKVAKQAVRRNCLRRRLREALRNLLRDHGLTGHPDIILIASVEALKASYWDLVAEVRELLGRARVWGQPAAAEGGG